MKPTRWFSAIFFFASSIALAGCYTHLATSDRPTSDQGYYAYHAPRPYYSDTIRPRSANVTLAEKPLIVYDTTMHGDTMFIDERQVQPAAQAENVVMPDAGTDGTTIINNYYGSSSYWDNYWGPTWGVSIGIGWPYYHSWYSPWWPYYNYSWYEPFGYFGAYPPYFDCYAPYYASYYPYYGGYYGHGYGHGFHDHDFGGSSYDGFGRNVRSGRIGGQYRAGSITTPVTQPGSTMAHANVSNPSTTNLTRATNTSLAETNAADELRSSADRNAPMHVVGPDASAEVTRSQSTDVVRTDAPPNGVSTRAAQSSASNGFANTSSRPVVVRRMDGQTITTSPASAQSDRQMIVVRRSAGYSSSGNGSSSRGYNSSSRGYNSSSRSYNSSSRGSSEPARSYSPPARSYSAPPEGRNSAPAESAPARSYSAPAESAPDRSGGGSSSSGGGERSGGGGGERSGGGGGERSGGGGGGGRR